MNQLRATVALTILGSALIAHSQWEPRSELDARLSANPTDPFADTDGDLLPDSLEWVTLTDPARADSNRNGVSDFLDVVSYSLPQDQTPPPANGFADHGARVLVHTVRTPDGSEHAYVNVLLRFAGSAPAVVTSVEPFLESHGVKVPIANLLLSTSQIRSYIRFEPGSGSMVLVSFHLCDANAVRNVLPCTIGAAVMIDGMSVLTGAHVVEMGNDLATVVAVDTDRFGFQTLTTPQDVSNPFWRGNHACLFRLVQVGQSRTQSLCEVVQAACDGIVTLYCDPQACRNKEGALVPLPIGLRLVRGG
jgi:hypothetical protein